MFDFAFFSDRAPVDPTCKMVAAESADASLIFFTSIDCNSILNPAEVLTSKIEPCSTGLFSAQDIKFSLVCEAATGLLSVFEIWEKPL